MGSQIAEERARLVEAERATELARVEREPKHTAEWTRLAAEQARLDIERRPG